MVIYTGIFNCLDIVYISVVSFCQHTSLSARTINTNRRTKTQGAGKTQNNAQTQVNFSYNHIHAPDVRKR